MILIVVSLCSVSISLLKLFRQKENHSKLKRGLFKQLDIHVLHTKKKAKYAYIPTILAIFFQLYPLLIWVGTIIAFILFSQKKKCLVHVLLEALKRMPLVKASGSGEKTAMFASNDASPQ